MTSTSLASALGHALVPDGHRPRDRNRTTKSSRSYRYRYRTQRRTADPSEAAAKRLFDIVGGLAITALLSPLLIGVAIAIKLTSRGPILFTQGRYGYRNRRFRIYKFRTMYTHLSDRSGRQQTVDGDPRVTPLGRVLRRFSVDELPQLLNVIKGDMSLVGPRPHVPGMLASARLYEDLIPYYFHRHSVRPGLTGLAQINGCRGSTAQASAAIDRIDYDLKYIETWSLWLDAKIIARTVRAEVLTTGS